MSLITAAEAPPRDLGAVVVWLGWDDYLKWINGRKRHAQTEWGERVELGPPFAPGIHTAFIAPTGEGKTTHAVGVLNSRKYVMALDPKGEDETLSASGYERVRSMPKEGMRWRLAHREDAKAWDRIYDRLDHRQPARVIVGGGSSSDDEDRANQDLMREAITYCRHHGRWTLYVDEFELLSSPRMFNLGDLIERMLITARHKGTSVVTSYQAQAWVSTHAHRQARQVTLWQTGSRAMIKNIAEGMGRDWREMGEAIDHLDRFYSLTVPRGPRFPMVMTKAPEV